MEQFSFVPSCFEADEAAGRPSSGDTRTHPEPFGASFTEATHASSSNGRSRDRLCLELGVGTGVEGGFLFILTFSWTEVKAHIFHMTFLPFLLRIHIYISPAAGQSSNHQIKCAPCKLHYKSVMLDANCANESSQSPSLPLKMLRSVDIPTSARRPSAWKSVDSIPARDGFYPPPFLLASLLPRVYSCHVLGSAQTRQ